MKERLIKCECCDETFQDVSTLVKHMEIHMKKIPSNATETGNCNTDSSSVSQDTLRKITQESAVSNIQRRPNTNKRKTYICEICSKPFSNGRLLSFHRRKHREEKVPEKSIPSPTTNKNRRNLTSLKSKSVLEAFGSSSSEKSFDVDKEEEKLQQSVPSQLIKVEQQQQQQSSDSDSSTEIDESVYPTLKQQTSDSGSTTEIDEPEEKIKLKEKQEVSRDSITKNKSLTGLIRTRKLQRIWKTITTAITPAPQHDLKLEFSPDNEDGVKCIPCAKIFKRKSHLNRHLRSHSHTSEIVCKYCKRSYQNQTVLTEHVQEQHQGNRAYQCSFCNKTFGTSSHLMRHRRIHTGVKPYACTYCEKAFSDKTSLTSHIVTHTGTRAYKCQYCDKAFARNTHLMRHLKLHVIKINSKILECKYCRLLFMCHKELKSHMAEHSNICKECNESFPSLIYLARHMHKHVIERPFKCQYCGKDFSDSGHLSTHLKKHSHKKLLHCRYCTKKSLRKIHLDAHEETHTGDCSFACQFCDKRFADSNSLTAHLRCHSDLQPYECCHCNKRFGFLSEHVKHVHTHTEEKPYKCDQCNRSFAYSSNLASHVRAHIDKKPHECHYCFKRFLTRAHHNRHMQVHVKDVSKPYACNKCSGKNEVFFPDQASLDIHMTETHQDEDDSADDSDNSASNTTMDKKRNNNNDNETEKKTSFSSLECQVCHRMFTRANNLETHLRCHTGERPYSCSLCHMTFALSGTHRRHLRTHSGEKPFTCPTCFRSFSASFSLKRHFRTHSSPTKEKIDEKVKDEDKINNNKNIELIGEGQNPYGPLTDEHAEDLIVMSSLSIVTADEKVDK